MYKKKYSGWLKHADFLILDIIVLQLSFYIAYCIRHGIGNMYENQLYAGMAIVLVLIDIVIGIIFENLHNVMKRGFWIEAIQTSKQVLEVFALFAIYLVTVQSAEQFSRTVLYLTMVFYWILSYVGRILWKTYLKHHNRYALKRSLIIVTKADRLPILTEQLQGETYASYQILGITVVDADMMGQQIGKYTVILLHCNGNGEKLLEDNNIEYVKIRSFNWFVPYKPKQIIRKIKLLYTSGDYSDLAAKIRLALKYPDRMRDIAKQGQSKMLNEMTAQNNAFRINELYREIVSDTEGI